MGYDRASFSRSGSVLTAVPHLLGISATLHPLRQQSWRHVCYCDGSYSPVSSWVQGCACGLSPALPPPCPGHTCWSQHKRGDSEQLLATDRQVIGLQVSGGTSFVPLHLHSLPPRCALGLPGGSWPGASGPTLHLGMLIIIAPPRAHSLPGRAGEVFGLHPLWYPRRLQLAGVGPGVRGCSSPCSLHGMEPPAATCHVAQHVTACSAALWS